MTSHTLRLADRMDLPDVQSIVTTCYTPYIDEIGQRPGPMQDDYEAHLNARHLWVATIADKVVGLIVLIPQTDALLLDNIAIAPDAQGSGLFRDMMDFADTQARERGLSAVTLYTHAKMTRNLTLYPHFGYAETHRKIENGLDRVFFRKTLA